MRKLAAAQIRDGSGRTLRIAKGAPAQIAALVGCPLPAEAEALAADGNRVLAVAAGPEGALALAGFIALSDPPRPEAAALIGELRALGVRTVMLTGDGAATARVVAAAVGLDGPVLGRDAVGDASPAADAAVFAGVLPADKLRLVRAFQRDGHSVGMCGDGVNDAPALRQAQMGIAVSTATDVAKTAAGMVLTEPGLGGVLVAVQEGRAAFRRVLTYALGMIARKVELVLLLAIGLAMTGQAVLTPMLMVLFLALNDVLTLSLSTDRTTIGTRPVLWRVPALMVAGAGLGLVGLAFSVAAMMTGQLLLGLDVDALRTLVFLAVIFGGQAGLYATRDRRPVWRARPGGWLMLSSALGMAVAVGLAITGSLVAPLPAPVIGGLFGAAVLLMLAIDAGKRWSFPRLGLE